MAFWKWAIPLLSLLYFTAGMAQRAEAQLELGFNGELVAGHWNPLRLTLRDQAAAELLILVDQGSLETAGTYLMRYHAEIPSSSGISTGGGVRSGPAA